MATANQATARTAAQVAAESADALQEVEARHQRTSRGLVRRVRSEVQAAAREEAMLLGEAGLYGWGQGRDAVGGPTIKLANVLARCWGNCSIDVGTIQDMGDAWIIPASFVDHETGFVLTRPFRMDKNFPVHGKHDAFRKDDMRFQIGASKATRNVILNALPEWYVSRAADECERGIREDMERRIASQTQPVVAQSIVDALAKFKVTEADVLRVYGVRVLAALTVDDLCRLGCAQAQLRDGVSTKEELFPPIEKATVDVKGIKGAPEANRGHGDENLAAVGGPAPIGADANAAYEAAVRRAAPVTTPVAGGSVTRPAVRTLSEVAAESGKPVTAAPIGVPVAGANERARAAAASPAAAPAAPAPTVDPGWQSPAPDDDGELFDFPDDNE